MGHCAQRAAKFVASRTPLQCAGGCGAFQRKSPTGGAAKGNAEKSSRPAIAHELAVHAALRGLHRKRIGTRAARRP